MKTTKKYEYKRNILEFPAFNERLANSFSGGL